MPLQAFSSTLAELYGFAEHATLKTFRQEALRLICRLIKFDGAICGNGAFDKNDVQGLAVEQVGVFNLAQSLSAEYNEALQGHPAAKAFLSTLRQPAVFDRDALHATKELAWLAALAQKYDVRYLLLHWEARSTDCPGLGIVLCRAVGPCFSRTDVALLQALWPHLMQASKINLRRALDMVDPHGKTRALALVNSHGEIDVMNEAMCDLLKLEWPDFDGRCIHAQGIASLIDQGAYRGKRIDISSTLKFGYLACVGRRMSFIDRLSPSERTVADHFAKGLKHKEIASRLNVSPNTVRNQIAQAYQKLDVHNKAELMLKLSSREAQ